MSSRKEKRKRRRRVGLGGGRRAGSTHIPTISRHTCAGTRVRPAAKRALTSLQKPWLRPDCGGGNGPGGRRSPCPLFRESGALEPSTQMTGTRLPPVWGWAVCECLFWMRRQRVQLPSLSTVHRPSS